MRIIFIAAVGVFMAAAGINDARDIASGGIPARPSCALWSLVRPACP